MLYSHLCSDVLGKRQTHTYDTRSTLIGDRDPAGGTLQKQYDPNFRPVAVTNPMGYTTYLAWSNDGVNLTAIQDAAGNPTYIDYDELNNPITIVDPLSHLTTYEYVGTRLTRIIGAVDGEITDFTYFPNGDLESVTDPGGHTTSYTYDDYGQRTSMTDPAGNTWYYTYDDLGRLVDSIDPLDRTTHNEYDDAGRLVRLTRNYDPDRDQNEENQYNVVTRYEYDEHGYQTAVIDTYDRRTRYEYDDNGRLVRTIDAAGHITRNFYDANGNLTATTDANGRTTHYEYDAAGRLVRVINPMPNYIRTSYNPDGTVASTTDARGNNTFYAYDELGRLVTVTDALGGVTTNEYDALGNLIAVWDARGYVTRYEYDAAGRLIRTLDPLDGLSESFYDPAGRLVQTIDPRGRATTYEYDEAGRLAAVIDARGNATRYEYDLVGRRTAVVDALGRRTSYTYDDLDRVVSVTDAMMHTVRAEYDAMGNVIARTDANDLTITFSYDLLYRLVDQTDPMEGVTSYTYDNVGNRLTVTDPNDNTTTTEYDALNRPFRVRDPNGGYTETYYDDAGNVIIVMDQEGNSIYFEHDDLNRQSVMGNAMETETYYTYDAVGNRTSIIDAYSRVTYFEYDPLGRLEAVTEHFLPGVEPGQDVNVRTVYTYDANGNRTSILDARGNETTFAYDELGRLYEERDPLGNTWRYGYDEVGNRVFTIDANGVTTFYEYDDVNRLTGIDYPDPDADVTFTYDDAGRRTDMTDGLGTTSWEYDDLNRPTAITDPFDAVVRYGYDAAGNRTSLTYPDGKTVHYGYDPMNQLSWVRDWNEQETIYYYTLSGRLEEVILPNGVQSFYEYDPAGRLVSLQHNRGAENLAYYSYEYDGLGNRLSAYEATMGGGTGPTVVVTVTESTGAPLAGRTVYAFDESGYSGYSKVTDGNGQAAITLPEGVYRFRVDVDGAQFWSGDTNHCAIGMCDDVMITVPEAVLVSVTDSEANPRAGIRVYAFDGSLYTGYNGTTDENGLLSLRLTARSYRFRADFNGTQFWSGLENHCAVPGCTMAAVTITLPVTVSVVDNLEMPRPGVKVYAFDGTTYTGFNGTTDEAGQVSFTLPEGEYRFRADFNSTQFWSAPANHCEVPGCLEAIVTVSLPLTVTVLDTDGAARPGLRVYAFNGATYAGFNGTTNEDGRVSFTLPPGSYRFRADYNATQFWSGSANHCEVPGCEGALVVVTKPVTVTVLDTDEAPKAGLKVYAFDGTAYTGYSGTTDAAGQVTLTLPQGDYRFRADLNGTQFWSGSANHCPLPGCETAQVTVSKPVTVAVRDSGGAPVSGVKVYAFNGTAYTGYNKTTDSNGNVSLTLPLGSYRFRADYGGVQYWSGSANHCEVPGCESSAVLVGPSARLVPPAAPVALGGGKVLAAPVALRPGLESGENRQVVVAVHDTDQVPQAGLRVYAFNGTTYTGYSGTTNGDGEVVLVLPEGSYRFRADLNGAQFWSAPANHCTVPDCTNAAVTVTIPLTVTVRDTDGNPQAGLKVYAFDGTTYTGYNGTTDGDGEVTLTLPEGEYRFRADLNGTRFWSGTGNHCALPGCLEASVTVTLPVLVTVLDTGGAPRSGVKVYAFDGTTYTGFNRTTDEAGQVSFTLPEGDYRFRADFNQTQFWSWTENHCPLPGCGEVAITVTRPVSVMVRDASGQPYGGLKVYAFSGGAYTGYNGTTDANGQVSFTLPQGGYRFRADYDGVQFWNSAEDSCQIPGCTGAVVPIPGGYRRTEVAISYQYDSLNRLTSAGYTDGTFFSYTYDEVGNRLTQEKVVGGQSSTVQYAYDDANRLVRVDGVPYTWDANGNLLSDGVNTYTYDVANRLTMVSGPSSAVSYAYSGLGDRLQETANEATTTFVMDLNMGITQALIAGETAYIYGNARIAQLNTDTLITDYYLGDALGSVRQMAGSAGDVVYTASYAPYGELLRSAGSTTTKFGYTNEYTSQGLVYLRARHYTPVLGRFLSRDRWSGQDSTPMSYNRWIYGFNNPFVFVDPTGNIPSPGDVENGFATFSCNCGWIDFGHANTELSKQIFDSLSQEISQLSQATNEYRRDVYAISLNQGIAKWTGSTSVSMTVVVRAGLGDSIKDSVALGIYRAMQEKIEFTQGDLGEWFTYFSFEDLTSDEIGFYLALKFNKRQNYHGVINPHTPGGTNTDAWSWLARICGYPDNRDDAKLLSRKQYEAIGGSLYGTYLFLILSSMDRKNGLHRYQWGSPLLCPFGDACSDQENVWPVEFITIRPISYQRNGKWWIYDEMRDGELIASETNSNFYLVKK